MSEQITWTHVDKLARKMHDERGMLPVGLTDAEVAHAFIKWQEKQRELVLKQLEERDRATVLLRNRVIELEEKARAPKSKTKKRLDALEKEIERIGAMLDEPPLRLPFTIGRCLNKHCGDKAREISPYCEKCEPDL